MRLRTLAAGTALLLSAAVALAEDFPGIAAILTPEEFRAAGLTQLTPEQIAILDRALARHGRAREAAIEKKTQERIEFEPRKDESFWSRFGLPFGGDKSEPVAMQAKVVARTGREQYQLDNGQVWVALDFVPVDLVGRDITIERNRFGSFSLNVSGTKISVGVSRIR